MKSLYFGTIGLIVLGFGSAFGESLPFNPGLWETTTTKTNFMTGQPETTTKTECLTETSYDPVSNMDDMGNCTITGEKLVGNTLTFAVQCPPEDGMTMTGDFTYTVTDDNMDGQMNMIMTGPMSMTMTTTWSGKRIGDC